MTVTVQRLKLRKLKKLEKAIRTPAKQRQLTIAERRRAAKQEARNALIDRLDPARDIPDGLHWFAILARQGREHMVAEALESRCDAFCFIPLVDMRPRRKHAGAANVVQPRAVQMPFLPRIVFAGFPKRPNWVLIESLAHYAGRVESSPGVPGVVLPYEIKITRDETELARKRRRDQLAKRAAFQPGDVVRVSGMTEVDQIERMAGRYAILKRMMLGASVKIDVSRVELVEAA